MNALNWQVLLLRNYLAELDFFILKAEDFTENAVTFDVSNCMSKHDNTGLKINCPHETIIDYSSKCKLFYIKKITL